MDEKIDIIDETELSYCPRCGSELTGELPVECPEHGPINIDYWESPWEAEESDEEPNEWAFPEFEEALDELNDELENAGLGFLGGADDDSGEQGRELDLETLFEDLAEDLEDDEQPTQERSASVKDRINRLLRRD